VAGKVARNRAPLIYYNAIEKILLAYIYQLIKIEGEDDNIARLKNGNEDENYIYKGDNKEEGEDRSETTSKSEDEDGDSDKDKDSKDEDIKGDKDKDEDNNINNDKYNKDSELEYKE